MVEAINVSQMSLNFNLREPRGNKCTNVYAIVKYGKAQLKFSIGCKVNCWQWDRKKQSPIINDKMSDEDVKNNIRVMNVISSFRFGYLDFFSYICKNSITISRDELKEFLVDIINSITENMANNQNLNKSVVRTPKATTLLKKAFEIFYTEIHPSTRESSKKIEKGKLNAFISYCEEIGKDKLSMLTTGGINDYKAFLMKKSKELGEKGDSNKTINNKCKTIVKFINLVLVNHNNFLRYKLSKVDYVNLEEVNAKGEEKKRRPLTGGEIQQLMDCDILDEKEKEIRDLFLLECNGSYRISDTAKLFDESQQKRIRVRGNEFILINTKKENIPSVIWVNDVVREILNKYKNGFKYVDLTNEAKYQTQFNRKIKKIFQKAKLDSIETYIDAKGIERKEKLCDIIGSHFARYTFIYNGLFVMGFTPSDLAVFTGHANDKMINEVYGVHTTDDTVNKAARSLEKVLGKKKEETINTTRSRITEDNINEQDDLIRMVKDALYCLGADLNELADINDYHELNVILYNEYHMQLVELGIDKDVKEVYRLDKLSLSERRKAIKELKDKIISERLEWGAVTKGTD